MFHKCALVACLGLTAAALGCGDEGKAPGSDGAEPQDVSREGGVPALNVDMEAGQDAVGVGSDAGSAVGRPDGGADAGPGPSTDAAASTPPSVARGDPSASYWDLRVRGVGLDRFEGKEVVVRLGRIDSPGERLAAGSARIANGSFELFFPQAWEAKVYKLKRGYIDAQGNGRCDAAQDLVFIDTRATQIDVLNVPADLSMSTGTDFVRAFYPDEDCAALNESWPLP